MPAWSHKPYDVGSNPIPASTSAHNHHCDIMVVMSQICRTCKIEKPLDEFSRRGEGYKTQCKKCHNEYVRTTWYVKNKQKQIDANAKWKANNKAKVLASRYKCDVEIIENLLAIGICQICDSEDNLVIDHDHETGFVRGILCHTCNTGLGKLGDTVDRVRRALGYLEQEPLRV